MLHLQLQIKTEIKTFSDITCLWKASQPPVVNSHVTWKEKMTLNLKLYNISPIGFETITYHTGQYTSISSSIFSPTLQLYCEELSLFSCLFSHTSTINAGSGLKKQKQNNIFHLDP